MSSCHEGEFRRAHPKKMGKKRVPLLEVIEVANIMKTTNLVIGKIVIQGVVFRFHDDFRECI